MAIFAMTQRLGGLPHLPNISRIFSVYTISKDGKLEGPSGPGHCDELPQLRHKMRAEKYIPHRTANAAAVR